MSRSEVPCLSAEPLQLINLDASRVRDRGPVHKVDRKVEPSGKGPACPTPPALSLHAHLAPPASPFLPTSPLRVSGRTPDTSGCTLHCLCPPPGCHTWGPAPQVLSDHAEGTQRTWEPVSKTTAHERSPRMSTKGHDPPSLLTLSAGDQGTPAPGSSSSSAHPELPPACGWAGGVWWVARVEGVPGEGR